MRFPLVGHKISLTDLQPEAARAVLAGGNQILADRFAAGGQLVRFLLVGLEIPLFENAKRECSAAYSPGQARAAYYALLASARFPGRSTCTVPSPTDIPSRLLTISLLIFSFISPKSA